MDMRAVSSDQLSRLCVERGDAEAWLEFVRRFQKQIALTALRVARQWGSYSQTVVDDLVQETYLRLCSNQCRLLRNFTASDVSSDPLGALIRVVAANVAHDYFRSKTAAKRGGTQPAINPELPDDEMLSDLWSGAKEIERSALIGEIEEELRTAPDSALSSRERLIFKLYFKQGMAANAIAAIPSFQLSTKGVESALHRVTVYLRSRLNPKSRKDAISADPKGEMRPFPMKGEEV